METNRAPKMTLQTQRVLKALLVEPSSPIYGSQICEQASLPSGTIYPILARLEKQYGWLDSFWEDPEISIAEGRPRRRYYRLNQRGIEAARHALAASFQSRQANRHGAQPGISGSTS